MLLLLLITNLELSQSLFVFQQTKLKLSSFLTVVRFQLLREIIDHRVYRLDSHPKRHAINLSHIDALYALTPRRDNSTERATALRAKFSKAPSIASFLIGALTSI